MILLNLFGMIAGMVTAAVGSQQGQPMLLYFGLFVAIVCFGFLARAQKARWRKQRAEKRGSIH